MNGQSWKIDALDALGASRDKICNVGQHQQGEKCLTKVRPDRQKVKEGIHDSAQRTEHAGIAAPHPRPQTNENL